ncbi:MAG: class I SAM-dependent methyltransferase, partial [Actinomycetota bacterium]
MLASDRQLPVSGGPEKRAYVRSVFTAIAPTYDRLNRIISFRFDQGWRRYAVARLG